MSKDRVIKDPEELSNKQVAALVREEFVKLREQIQIATARLELRTVQRCIERTAVLARVRTYREWMQYQSEL